MKASLKALFGATAILALGVTNAFAKTEVRVVVAEYSSKTKAVFDGMATDFMAANPDVDIKIEMVAWDNLQQRLTTDIAGGTAPDIAIIGTRSLLDYAANDVAEPLDEYMTPEFKAKFVEAFLTPSVIDGKTWGLPVAASARAMYYNKALLKTAGIDTPPANWTDLVAAAEKVKATGGGAYGFGLQGKEIETDAYWYYALWTHGGDIIQDGKSGIASDAAVKAATLYKSMLDAGLTEPSPTGLNRQDVESLFKQGRVAMILSGPWLRGQIKAEAPTLDYGIASIPEGTVKATYGVTDTIMMFKSSKVKAEAWKFLSETAFSDKWRVRFSMDEGFIPVTKGEAADPFFADDPQLKIFVDQLAFAKFAPIIPNWEQMADATIAALQNIYLGKAEPKAALTEAATKIDGYIK